MDLVVSGKKFPQPGETITGGNFYRAHGGKGANQAVAAARLGNDPRVTFIGAVGDDDFGRSIREALDAERIDVQYLQIVQDAATGVALIMVDGSGSGENMISVASGANTFVDRDLVEAVPDEVFDTADVFLASLEVGIDAVRRGLERARNAGALTILNPAPVEASKRTDILNLLPLVDILIPNSHEAEALAAPDDVIGADLHEGIVILTLGESGCQIIEPNGTRHAIPAHSAGSVVDTTAAGDCFCGAVAVQLAGKADLMTSCRFASIAAGMCVTRQGAQPSIPCRSDIGG
ncbi:MAG: ribokinase [Verrucomicrobiales bacterium]|jgi:ribokinase